MRAVRQAEFGGPETLRWETVEDPQPDPDQLRIRVAVAGVQLLDAQIRRGLAAPRAMPSSLPYTPGREVAGVVDRVGSDVDPGWLGRRTVADLGAGGGGYAELAVVCAGSAHEIPGDLSDEDAVAAVGTGRTAQAILELASIGPDDVVLVTAAAGGVGVLLLRAALAVDAAVVGAAGGPVKTAVVGSLGAASVDYRSRDWTAQVPGAAGGRAPTVALDGVGGDVGYGAMSSLAVGGRLVMYGQASGILVPLTADDVYARGITVSAAVGARLIRRPGGTSELEVKALAAAADGSLRPLVGQRFRLRDAWRAHAALATRATVGKTVLHV